MKEHKISTPHVNINGVRFEEIVVWFTSVNGPTLYYVYTKSVSEVIRRFYLSYYSYADDTQL